MANPVEFRQFTPRDSRGDLMRHLDQAPAEHAEALLECYDLLQRLHEKGLIDLLNGLLGASDTITERLVDVASSKQAVAGLRIALMFSNLLNEIDTDRVHGLLTGADDKPPSLITIARTAVSEDARRGMVAGVGLLEVFGKALYKSSASHGMNVNARPELTKPKLTPGPLKKGTTIAVRKYGLIAARILAALIFLLNGMNIISQQLAAHELAVHGFPSSLIPAAIWGARILQIAAGTALVLGIYPRIAALALIGFLIPVTFMAHPFWEAVSTPLYPVQLINFFKNVCMCGGLLFIAGTIRQPAIFPRKDLERSTLLEGD
jgi:putative oxidoreductase